MVETSSHGLTRPSDYSNSIFYTRETSGLEKEKAFTSVLIDSICEGIKDALGKDALEILVSKGLLDNSNEPKKLERQLATIFGTGHTVLERIIVKTLYRKLRVPYDSTLNFDYAKALVVAKNALFED